MKFWYGIHQTGKPVVRGRITTTAEDAMPRLLSACMTGDPHADVRSALEARAMVGMSPRELEASLRALILGGSDQLGDAIGAISDRPAQMLSSLRSLIEGGTQEVCVEYGSKTVFFVKLSN